MEEYEAVQQPMFVLNEKIVLVGIVIMAILIGVLFAYLIGDEDGSVSHMAASAASQPPTPISRATHRRKRQQPEADTPEPEAAQ